MFAGYFKLDCLLEAGTVLASWGKLCVFTYKYIKIYETSVKIFPQNCKYMGCEMAKVRPGDFFKDLKDSNLFDNTVEHMTTYYIKRTESVLTALI